MRLLILISAILIGSSLQSVAQQPRTYIGYAETSCGSYTNDRSKNMAWGMETWALGFISGQNWASTTPDSLKGVDAAALYAWLDNYCRQNPLEKFPKAVMALARELDARAARQ